MITFDKQFIITSCFNVLLQQGNGMIKDEHHDAPDIKAILDKLNVEWTELYDKSGDKGKKLRQAAQQHLLNRALADAQVL
jgi:spectrin beta